MKNFSDLEKGTLKYPTEKTACRKKPYYYKSFKMNQKIMDLEISIDNKSVFIRDLKLIKDIKFGVTKEITPKIGKVYDFGCLEQAIKEYFLLHSISLTREQLIDISVNIKRLED